MKQLTFINILFFPFICLTILLYFIFPKKIRWCVLLIASISFYATWGVKQFIFVLSAALIVYCGAIFIEKNKSKKIKKIILWFCYILILWMLLYVKIGKLFINSDNLIIPLGISYYTFLIIGYLADVYWKKIEAEKNPLKLLNYMLYFPHILQGPIPKYKKLVPQLIEGGKFSYKNLTYGLQRMLYGYFKKLVIADRFSIIANSIFNNYVDYQGCVFIIGIICSTISLYCDFSGCMDIALGCSEIFGIKLDENFIRPFFSKSASEFWRRWHITLGTWFKDYIYMPIVVNPKFIKLSGKVRNKFGKRASKIFVTIIPLFVVWFLTGLWHGTGLNYICWGGYWFLIILIESVFEPEFVKIRNKFNIDVKSTSYQRYRIFLLWILFGGSRLFSASKNLTETAYIFKSLFTVWNPWILVDGSIFKFGLDEKDFIVGVISLIILIVISNMQEKDISVRDKLAAKPLIVRWIILYIAIFSVLIFGMFGPDFDVSNFAYMRF